MASTTTSTGGDLDQWIEIAKNCKYLPENDLKVLVLSFFNFESVLDKYILIVQHYSKRLFIFVDFCE